jgi:hypothetical protein
VDTGGKAGRRKYKVGGERREAELASMKYSSVMVKRAAAVRAGFVAKVLQLYQIPTPMSREV